MGTSFEIELRNQQGFSLAAGVRCITIISYPIDIDISLERINNQRAVINRISYTIVIVI